MDKLFNYCLNLTIIFLFSSPLTASINVSSVATAGNGTAVSPWTGWDTAFSWVAEQQYNFPSGVYAYTDSPNFLKTGIALVGEAGTVLKHTGSGNAVVFDNPGGQSPNYLNWTQNVRMENFIIQGNVNTTNGILLRGVRNGIFKHISVRDVSGAGLWTEACVTNMLDNFRVTHHEMPNDVFNVMPIYGIVFAARGGDTSTTWSVINPVIEGVSQIGIWVKNGCYGNTIINGTVEGNLGKGAVIESWLNTFINTDFEVNVATDIEIKHSRNILQNVFCDDSVIISAGQSNRLIGGHYKDITINSNVDFTALEGILWNGTLTDSNVNTIKVGNQATIQGGFRFDSKLGNVLPKVVGLSINGSIVSTDALSSSTFAITANQNFLLDNPVNPTNGQKITWRIWHPAAGVSMAYGSKFRPPAGKAFPGLSFFPGFDYISAIYNSIQDTWDIQ